MEAATCATVKRAEEEGGNQQGNKLGIKEMVVILK